MGQYHYLVNLTKKQFVHPHQIGNGLKLREQVGWPYSTSTALVMLLAASNGRGGGDFRTSHPLVGSWAGDQIAFVGDYAEAQDLVGWNAPTVYAHCDMGKFKNISEQVRHMMISEFGIRYVNDNGWLGILEPTPAPAPAPLPEQKKSGRKHAVENNPLVEFYYPKSDGSGSYFRKVRVISADSTYIFGLDTGDKNRIKKFRRNRITLWKTPQIGTFNLESMP